MPGKCGAEDGLLAAVWPEVVVTEGGLKILLGQIRQALGETAKRPQHFVTVPPAWVSLHRAGDDHRATPSPGDRPWAIGLAPNGAAPGPTINSLPPELIVGRDMELARLQRW